MKSHRTIIFIGGLLLALVMALPAPALASSLLSGYGGPGQGNQAILGSALVNGPRGGGSGGAGAGSSTPARSSGGEAGEATSTTGSGSTSATSPRSGSSARSSSGASPAGGAGSGQGHSVRGGQGATSSSTRARARAGAGGFYPAAERLPAGTGSGPLGLSGAELIYVILALGALVSMGVLMRRLGRTSTAGSPIR